MGKYEKNFSRGRTITIISICSVLVLLLAGMGIYFTFVSGLPFGRILPNMHIAGVDVGGMRYGQAVTAVSSAVADTYGRKPMVVTVHDRTLELSPAMVVSLPDVKGAVKEAYAFGRTGLPQKRKAQQEIAAQGPVSVDITKYIGLNQDEINRQVMAFAQGFESTFRETTWKLEGQLPDMTQPSPKMPSIVITLGQVGRHMDGELLCQKVQQAFVENQFALEYNCPVKEPKELNLQDLYDKYASAPVNAAMDPETFEVKPQIDGYDFDLAKAEAELKKAEGGDTVTIPMRPKPAEIQAQQLEDLLFRDVLATHTATAGSIYGRNINLKLSCQAINGIVLMPGEVFSYNDALGERTPDKGWQKAAGYVGNKTVEEYGGGICQASSCLYYVAMQADLDIVTRVNHGFISAYMPFGMDATVSWGGPHFRFRNSTDYPLRIEASASGGSVTVSLIGTDTKDYYVKMEYEVLDKEDFEVKYIEMPPDNPDGYTDGQVITTPYTGYTISTYRCKYDKETDTLLSREHEATSHYSSRNKEICKIVVPEETVPETTVPETTVPETTVPETTVPETTVPETTVPETTVPETTVPETTVPETTVPETTVPETTVPETTVPETTVSETTVPETTVSETGLPPEPAAEPEA